MMPGHEHAHRLLLVLETATFGALAMGTFTGFVLGAASAAILFGKLDGFVAGVLVTLAAAAIAGKDFD